MNTTTLSKKLILLSVSSFLINADEVKTLNNTTGSQNSNTSFVIKVIEGRAVLNDSIEGKEIEAKLGNLRAKLEKDISDLQKGLEKEANELKSRARTVDPEILEQDYLKIQRKEKEIKTKAESSQEEFQRTLQRELAKFNGKLQETVTQNAKKLNWDIVSLKETGEIIYVSDRANGTAEITKTLDNKIKQEKAEHAKKVAAPVAAPAA